MMLSQTIRDYYYMVFRRLALKSVFYFSLESWWMVTLQDWTTLETIKPHLITDRGARK